MIINLNFNADVGKLTNTKIIKIKNLLKNEFEDSISTPTQLIMKGTLKQIIVAPNYIQYSYSESQENNYKDIIMGLFNLLMLDSICTTMISIVNYKEMQKSAMEISKDKYGSIISSAIGTGITNYFKYKEKFCLMKIEPYFQDDSKMYLEFQYFLENVDIKNLEQVIKGVKDDYNRKMEEINI